MNKGLEALEYLKENKRRHWLDNDNSSECLDSIEKELKALEIIKNKEVSVAMFVDMYGYGNSCKNDKERLELYNENIGYYKQHRLLTKEEWELLKEVLL